MYFFINLQAVGFCFEEYSTQKAFLRLLVAFCYNVVFISTSSFMYSTLQLWWWWWLLLLLLLSLSLPLPISISIHHVVLAFVECVCVLQERSRLCVRMWVVVGHLRRQIYVKFTSALTLVNVRTPVTCLAVARRLPVQLTTRTTSAFTPVSTTQHLVWITSLSGNT